MLQRRANGDLKCVQGASLMTMQAACCHSTEDQLFTPVFRLSGSCLPCACLLVILLTNMPSGDSLLCRFARRQLCAGSETHNRDLSWGTQS